MRNFGIPYCNVADTIRKVARPPGNISTPSRKVTDTTCKVEIASRKVANIVRKVARPSGKIENGNRKLEASKVLKIILF